MEVITLTGRLINDCEPCVDSRGKTFIRFKVACVSKDRDGKTIYNVYRCICFYPGYENLKENEHVFIVGDQCLSIHIDEKGKSWILADVFVRHIDRDYNDFEE